MEVKTESEVAQSCLTPSDPMDRSLPGSSVHGILQARLLQEVANAFSDTPQYSTLNCFYSNKQTNKQKTTPTFHMQTPWDSDPVSSHRVHNPSREASGWAWGLGDHRRGSRQVLWEPEALRKSQEPGPELSLWVSQMKRLEAAGCTSVPLRMTSDKVLNLFLHLRTSMTTLPCVLRNQTTNLWSKRPLSFPLLPNHEWPCSLDSGQKTLTGTLWTLSLWSETRPWDVNTYTIPSLGAKGFIFTFWHV